MTYAADDKKLKAWEDGLQAAVTKDPTSWNTYDQTIQDTLSVYTTKLQPVMGYTVPDWMLVKAMLWTESGATRSAWTTAPMQIGVNGDPGLKEMLTSSQGHMILPDIYLNTLTTTNVPKDGTKNIQAGVGYLLKISARFDYVAVLSKPEPLPLAQSVAPPPSPPPPVASLAPQPLTMRKKAPRQRTPAHHRHTPKHIQPKRVLSIVGWRALTTAFVAAHYNAGDGNYSRKLDFCIRLMQNPPKPVAPAVPGKK